MKEKFRITRNSISIIGGICFILLALVTMFSNNTPFAFLSKIVTYSFGFIGFWILMPFILIVGLYLILKKQLIKLKVGLSLWGAFIIIICFIILCSNWAAQGYTVNGVYLSGFGRDENGAAKYLIFSNAATLVKQITETSSSSFGPSPSMGGGYVGFIIAGAINSAITPIGLNIICWMFFIGGLMMLLNRQVVALSVIIKRAKQKRKDIKNNKKSEYHEVTFDEPEEEVVAPPKVEDSIPLPQQMEKTPFEGPSDEAKSPIRPIYESFHTSNPINNDYSLKKAHFNLANEPVIEDSLVKKIGDAETPVIAPEVVIPEKANFVEETFEPEENIEPITVSKEENPNSFEEPFFSQLVEKEEASENVPVKEIIPEVTPEPEPAPEEVDPLFRPQPKANLVKNYIYPNLDLLDLHEEAGDSEKNEASCEERTNIINTTLADLRVGGQVISHTVGPSVTRYDLQMNSDVSVTTVQKYISDISIRLNGASVRFEQIVAGKSTSGLEIPNEIRTNVGLRESIAGLPAGEKYLLNIPFGKSISGELKFANLADFPHMLVSGTTGSGKSIFIHSTILTLIMRNKPEELKLVLVDPKKVEMNYYKNIPHLLCPTICDVSKANIAFKKLVDEMERRYNLFQMNNVRDIKGFNAYAKTKDLQPLPYIVVFVDEYADLVDTCKEIRDPVVRIMQKARAAGIHMVIATQRPSVNVIDGVIKANVATRVALMSASQVDSVTIIGEGGAEKLLGNGDMLIECPLISRSTKPRVQGCFVSENEILRVCDFLREHYQPQYDPTFLNLEPKVEEKHSNEPAIEAIDKSKNEDEQYEDIKEQVMHREYCSISFIQRSFAMGFSRAGKIFNRLVQEGIVADKGDARGSKVLVYQPAEQQMGTIEQSTYIPDSEGEEN